MRTIWPSRVFSASASTPASRGLPTRANTPRLAGISVDYRVGTFYALPFAARSFDAVIAWNVLYHGDGEIARAAVAGIARVLQDGGMYVGTMLSSRNAQYGRGREVAPDTFVVDGDPGDKGHPHFYCDTQTLIELHREFEILDVRDREQTPGANHWEFTLERREHATRRRR